MSMSVCSNAQCNCSLRIVYWRSLPMSWQISVDAVLRSVQKTAIWQTRRKRSRSGEAG